MTKDGWKPGCSTPGCKNKADALVRFDTGEIAWVCAACMTPLCETEIGGKPCGKPATQQAWCRGRKLWICEDCAARQLAQNIADDLQDRAMKGKL